MARPTTTPMPAAARSLAELGQNIRLARLRRGLTAEMVAQRAGLSRPTLRGVKKGNPRVVMGAYLNVLHVLGLEKSLAAVGRDDELGRRLQDAGLQPRERAPKRSRGGGP